MSVAQLVEHWSPKPGVVGSNPARRANGEVAQLVRASVSYAEGQRFDPAPRYKKYNLIIRNFIINFFIVVF